MGLSGHDIRMKEFRRAVLRGYATADVDMFLTEVAVALDSLDPDRRPPAHATGLTDSRPALSPAPKVSPVQGVVAAGGGEDDARAEAERIVAQARASAAALQEQAAQTAEAAIRDAKAHAERGLRNARERAAGLLHDAHDRQQRAARLEAEAELRLAHVEQRLADKARVLADEARRLDAIAAWLARDDVSGSGGNEAAANAAPAHAAPPEDVPHLTDEAGDIVPFKRSAET